jgi:hypothetical protein
MFELPLKPDPPPRRDGCCVVCRRKRKPPATKYGLADWYTDPFCSSVCARKWHGTTIAAGAQSGHGMRVS